MENYLVTGGAGFIGSHLVEKLMGLGNNVYVIDNLSTGKLDNLESSLNSNNFKFFEGDIKDINFLKSFFEENSVDHVFNLAAIVSVPYSVKNPRETLETNFEAFKLIAELSHRYGAKGITQVGSSAEYGEVKIVPITEDMADDNTEQLSPYGRSKYLATKHALSMKCEDFKTCSLRFFNVYGPKQDPKSPYSGVISKFFGCVKNKKPITIFGDGKQTRDFVHVSDVANALSLSRGISKGVFNVGTNKGISISELASKVFDCSGINMGISYSSPRNGDINHSLANIDRIEKTLGWKPLIKIDEGLRNTYKWYLKN